MSFYEGLVLALEKLPAPIAMDIIILGCWNIWMQRNGRIFRNADPTFQAWKHSFKEDLNLLNRRIRKKHDACFQGWIVFLFITSLARFGFLPFVPPIVTYYYFLLMKIP